MKRVLVTGASGFVGSHLVTELLARRYVVRAFVRPGSPATFPQDVEVVRGDIRRVDDVAAALAACDTVIHLAAKVHALGSRIDDWEQDEVTREGTRNVVNACAREGVARLVFVSTLAVHGTSEEIQDEDSPLEVSSAYGLAKLEGERLVLQLHRETGIHVSVLRPAMVYGTGCKGNLTRLIRAVRRPYFVIPGGPENRRSVLHVRNLIQAIILAATRREANGRIYVVTDSKDYSTQAIVKHIARAVGRKMAVPRVPVGLLHFAARMGDAVGSLIGRRVPFDSAALQKLIGSQYFSSSRIARELGYKPQYDFESSIDQIVR